MNKRELIRTIQDAHRKIREAVEGASDERLFESVGNGWTGKDLIAHMAWWHLHSAEVITDLRAGRDPYDQDDPANGTDARNDRIHREHKDDAPQTVRETFSESFDRLLAALNDADEDELFEPDHWKWTGGEPLAETILWDTSRHYEAHRDSLAKLDLDFPV